VFILPVTDEKHEKMGWKQGLGSITRAANSFWEHKSAIFHCSNTGTQSGIKALKPL
jgi:hypothetical protein